MAELTAREIELMAQAVAQALQGAIQQAAQQTAQQIGQQIAEAQVKQAQTAGTAATSTEKEIGETGFSERYQTAGNDRSDIGYINLKNLTDQYVTLGAGAISQLNKELAQINALSLSVLAEKQQIVHQAQQNANVNIDNLQKQHLAHRDIATKSTWQDMTLSTDATWNPTAHGAENALNIKAVQLDDASMKALAVALAAAVADIIKPKVA